MLDHIRLQSFRRFDDHVVRFRPTTVIVGANNAGKSTIIEAIRLVSLVANRHGSLNFSRAPRWLADPAAGWGVSPGLRDVNTNLATVVNTGTGPPATVDARFTAGERIHISIDETGAVFASIWGRLGKLITSKGSAAGSRLPRVAVQPLVAPLLLEEKVLEEATVKRGMDSPLAPQHFRNQIRLLRTDHFDHFKRLSEETWPTLQVQDLIGGHADEIDRMTLLVRDRAFAGEVGNMGHGLQMWLQIMWFLTRNREAPTVVLDEPDVYMHPDLQRRLMRRLKLGYRQVVVATHSVEIMAEARPDEVLVIDGDLPESPWAADHHGLQTAITSVGGMHNLDLARLALAKRKLIVEGDDVDLLRRPYDQLFPSSDPLDSLPKQSVGGWGGWQQAIGASAALTNAAGDLIASYCLFDSDYASPAEVLKRYKQAGENEIRLHIWWCKELENMLIVPEVIDRIIRARIVTRRQPPELSEIANAIDDFSLGLREDLIDDLGQTYQSLRHRAGIREAKRWAHPYLEHRLELGLPLSMLVGGKKLISALSGWSTERSGVGFNSNDLALEIRASEVHPDLESFLRAVHDGEPVPTVHRDRWAAIDEEFLIEPERRGRSS